MNNHGLDKCRDQTALSLFIYTLDTSDKLCFLRLLLNSMEVMYDL